MTSSTSRATTAREGRHQFNDRGKWLHEERERREAKEVGAAWLKDYVEKKADEKK